jgi:hypothetical protein
MTTTTFDLVHENRPCRVEERRSAKTPRGFAGYMMVKVRYADGEQTYLTAGAFFRKARCMVCQRTVTRCECEPV